MTFKFQMDKYINYIDFIFGGNKNAYDMLNEKDGLKVIYHWGSGIGRAIDWELCEDFEQCIPMCNFEKFSKKMEEINSQDWSATTPLFAEIYYEDTYLGSLLITKDTFHLLNSWEDDNE